MSGCATGLSGFSAFEVRADERENQHTEEYGGESQGRRADPAGFFRQQRESSVDKLDVHPVDQQRSMAELDDGAESHCAESPAAPGVSEQHEQQHKPAANQEKLGAGVPEIVGGVDAPGRRIER